jgi:hypothetical protein
MSKTTTSKRKPNSKETIMITRTLAASVLALSLLSPVAFAGNGPAGSEVTNHNGQYLVDDVVTTSTKGFSALAAPIKKQRPVGQYVDETPQESSERSSSH